MTPRVLTLTDEESDIIDAVRTATTRAKQERYAALQGDMRGELEDIYQTLTSTPNWEYEEMVQDLTQRIYRLLW